MTWCASWTTIAADKNDWLAVNQFTVVENRYERRADVVLFVNGLPLAVMELKNAADEKATIWAAFNQLQTYKSQIPSLFAYNEALIISDGLHARIGNLDRRSHERFMPWRTIDGSGLADERLSQLQVVIEGVLRPAPVSSTSIRYFIVFEDNGNGVLIKKMAAYHQYHAVNLAVNETLRACAMTPRVPQFGEVRGLYLTQPFEDGMRRDRGDRRIGVVWHTQGSGKSLTMAFYAGKIIQHPGMENPTIVVLTDRNDLDNQLFDNFAQEQGAAAAGAPSRRRAGPTCASCSAWRRAALSSPPSRSFPSMRTAGRVSICLCCRSGATSSSSPTRRSAASTISSTASPGRRATRCPTRRSSVSPARPIERADANTPRRVRRLHQHLRHPPGSARRRGPCRSTTRAGWRSWR